MSIKIQPILPKFLGVEHFEDIPEELVIRYINYIKNLEMVTNSPSDYLTKEQRLLDSDLIFKVIKKNIINSAKEYLKFLNFECEDIQISNSWAYLSKPNPEDNPENIHNHLNSLISGVFYLTDGAPLYFYESPTESLPFKQLKDLPSVEVSTNNLNSYMVEPKKGLLVLFPSNLDHFVSSKPITPLYSPLRISIAFNIIPKGKFGPPYAQLYL